MRLAAWCQNCAMRHGLAAQTPHMAAAYAKGSLHRILQEPAAMHGKKVLALPVHAPYQLRLPVHSSGAPRAAA